MLKRDEIFKPNSCLNNAEDTEPIFVLRANDPVAPHIVRSWAAEYRSEKMKTTGKLTEAQKAKYQEALNLANEMETWKAANPD